MNCASGVPSFEKEERSIFPCSGKAGVSAIWAAGGREASVVGAGVTSWTWLEANEADGVDTTNLLISKESGVSGEAAETPKKYPVGS